MKPGFCSTGAHDHPELLTDPPILQFFADKTDKHPHGLRAINYPDQDREPIPGQLRTGAHTDYGILTILRQDDAPGGLATSA
jgi:isopenicillin N synthase-like dioxygenase